MDYREDRIYPFYLVCDESLAMLGEPVAIVNDALAGLYRTLRSDPVISFMMRFGIIGFGEVANVIQPLARLDKIGGFPEIIPEGRSNYANAFRVLKREIEKDVLQLSAVGNKIYRPTVFLFSGGIPADDEKEGSKALDELLAEEFMFRPKIFVFRIEVGVEDSFELGNAQVLRVHRSSLLDSVIEQVVNALYSGETIADNDQGERELESVENFDSIESSSSLPYFDDCHYRPYSVGLEGRLTPTAREPGRRVGPTAWHPVDSECEAFDHQRVQVRSVSLRGHAHRYDGSIRQDAMAHSLLENWVGLAVADGLGSERMSHVGAALAAKEATTENEIRALAAWTDEIYECTSIRRSFVAVAEELGSGLPISELRSTLTVAVVEAAGDGELQAVVAQVGDSEPWLLRDEELVPLFPRPRGDSGLASSAVCPLPDSLQARVTRIGLKAGDQLLLTTDGVGHLLANDNKYRRALVGLLSAAAPTPASLMAVVDAPVKTYDDDRTLIVLRVREA